MAKSDAFPIGQVAKVLSVDPRRVKNYVDVPAYGIQAQQLGKGRGSRKLFWFADVLRLAIAEELSRFGFGPDATGAALGAIPESKLTSWTRLFTAAAETGKEPDSSEFPMLVCREGKWRVQPAKELKPLFEVGGDWHATCVLNLANLLEPVIRRISELEGQGEL